MLIRAGHGRHAYASRRHCRGPYRLDGPGIYADDCQRAQYIILLPLPVGSLLFYRIYRFYMYKGNVLQYGEFGRWWCVLVSRVPLRFMVVGGGVVVARFGTLLRLFGFYWELLGLFALIVPVPGVSGTGWCITRLPFKAAALSGLQGACRSF